MRLGDTAAAILLFVRSSMGFARQGVIIIASSRRCRISLQMLAMVVTLPGWILHVIIDP